MRGGGLAVLWMRWVRMAVIAVGRSITAVHLESLRGT